MSQPDPKRVAAKWLGHLRESNEIDDWLHRGSDDEDGDKTAAVKPWEEDEEFAQRVERFWKSVDNAVRERDFARSANMMDGLNELAMKMPRSLRERMVAYIEWAGRSKGWGKGTNSDMSAVTILKNPQRH